MKKIAAIIASTAILSSALSAFPAFAEEYDDYCPKLYFVAQESDGYQILNSGKVYFNKNAASSGESTLKVNTYIRDDNKLVGGFVVMFKAEPEIRLSNPVSPKDVYGVLPYDMGEYYKIGLNELKNSNSISIVYPQLTMDPDDPDRQYYFTLTGENSDDYPLAIFDAALSEDTPVGNYSIDFVRTNTSGTNVIYKPSAKKTIEFFPSGENAPSLGIGVTDRLLGDIDNSGAVDGSDATLCLRAFGNALNTGETGLSIEEEICADVDGNGVVDGSDATLILKYYSYQLAFGDTDFNELIKKDLNK